MMRKTKNLLAIFFTMVFVLPLICPIEVEAAPAAPTSVIFDGWNNEDFTNYYIKYYLKNTCDGTEEKIVNAATGKQIQYWYLAWQQSGWNRVNDYNMPKNSVSLVYIRSYKYNSKGNKVYSKWSNPCIIIPWAKKSAVKVTRPSSKKAQVKVSWEQIKGATCYNIAMTTNPSGKWYTVKSRLKSTSTTISSFRGAKLKKKQNYYIRVITGKYRNGKYYYAPAPTGNYYSRGFRLK